VWTVVGLGNPGSEYAGTRHNLGFLVVDELLRRAGVRARRGAGDYRAALAPVAGRTVLLVKPSTYVNRSGRVVRQLAAGRSIAAAELLVVLDDVYLPFGRLRLRPGGSAGGHNGMRSILEALGTEAVPRLRVGVGGPESGTALPDWVLGPFTDAERQALGGLVGRAADGVERVVELGVDGAIPLVNAPPPGV
jgi:PTH1 family peptidyl-tRNA hydrolase